MAKRAFRLLEQVTITIPETLLETRVKGEVVQTMNVPESSTVYKEGYLFRTRNKKEVESLMRMIDPKLLRELLGDT